MQIDKRLHLTAPSCSYAAWSVICSHAQRQHMQPSSPLTIEPFEHAHLEQIAGIASPVIAHREDFICILQRLLPTALHQSHMHQSPPCSSIQRRCRAAGACAGLLTCTRCRRGAVRRSEDSIWAAGSLSRAAVHAHRWLEGIRGDILLLRKQLMCMSRDEDIWHGAGIMCR